MKLYAISSLLFCALASLNSKLVNSQSFSDENHRSAYDVSQSVAQAVGNIQAFQNGDISQDYSTKELLDNLIKVISHPNNLRAAFGDLSLKCLLDLKYVGDHLTLQDLKNKTWAVQMVDAVAKPESGILNGNVRWLGDYDECIGVRAPETAGFIKVGGFQGKYCKVGLGEPSYLQPILGFCIPDTCNLPDRYELDLGLLNSTLLTGKFNVSLTCIPLEKKLSNGAIATIVIMSAFTFLMVLGSSLTIIKHYSTSKTRKNSCNGATANGKISTVNDSESNIQDTANDDDQVLINEGSKTGLSIFIERVDPFLNCFCIFTNGSKLLNTDATEGQLLSLHGIRFLSMSWVIVCHVYISSIGVIRSFNGLLDKVDNFPFQVILNGFFSVDSFFVLSGFLMSYLYFQEASKNKGRTRPTQWLYFYVHRYLRLTPVYMIVLAFYTTIAPYMTSGPSSAAYDEDPNCQKHWWWNLLYINNFNDSSEMCMGWSWYLANDMQFFAISPLFLITLWRWPKIGYSILAVFLFAVWAVSFYITYHFKLVAGGLGNVMSIAEDKTFLERWMVTFDKIYTKPYTRMAPYIVGIALGHFMFKIKVTNYKPDFKTLLIGWSVAIPVGLTSIYGLYHANPSLVAASFYNALTRTTFSICLGWVIFVCLVGRGGAVDKILSFKLFIPLSRLTYCAYLIHLIVVTNYIQSLRANINFDHPTLVLMFLGFMVVTYAVAMLVSLIFESPLIRLEKFIRSKFKS